LSFGFGSAGRQPDARSARGAAMLQLNHHHFT
jgi:hypothetical protein